MIAALFVEPRGCYAGLPGVELWDEARDARKYAGPWRVVAHPPCERWGRYWFGGPSVKIRKVLGDDGGCFASALASVERWGGVLEHPAATHAWRAFGLARPLPQGGWTRTRNGWVSHVEQGNYGHPARKATWLYLVGTPRELLWGPSAATQRLDEGFHSAAERREARARGQKPRQRLTRSQNLATPPAFRDALLSLAEAP